MNPLTSRFRTLSVCRLGLWAAVACFLGAGELRAQLEPMPAAAADVRVTIAAPKECFADKPGTFEVRVVNNGTEATRAGLEVVVSHGVLSRPAQQRASARGGIGVGVGFGGVAASGSSPGNAVRQTKLALPALAAGESKTFQVELTPRRIGEFRLFAVIDNRMVGSASSPVRFDPAAGIADLLPAFKANLTPHLPSSLTDVAELSLEDRPGNLKLEESFEHVVHTMDRIEFVNRQKSDAHAAALLEKRPDMNGVPMAMGDACRLKPERAANFSRQVTQMRAISRDQPIAQHLKSLGAQSLDGRLSANETSAHIAALVQVFGPESASLRLKVIKHLATLKHEEAGRAIAGMAVFAPEVDVRTEAVAHLQDRPEKEYADVLVRGLNYPWPDVAANAAAAIVKLKKTSLLPKLVDLLEGPDPRAPQTGKDGKVVVREMVKINHLRNCLLCHAPNSRNQDAVTSAPVLVAPAPLPNQPLRVSMGSGVAYYSDFPIPEVLVRFDVTYLRQDFSMTMRVADHQPWPEMQRFDFLVRTRAVSDKDADAYRKLLQPKTGALNPYQQAAHAALRELTGRNAEPTGPAWRRVLEQMKS